jgi:hypothetical protein
MCSVGCSSAVRCERSCEHHTVCHRMVFVQKVVDTDLMAGELAGTLSARVSVV